MKESEIKERVKEGWVRVRFIQEVMGFPKDYLEHGMDGIIGKLDGLPGVKVIKQNVHEPKKIGEKMHTMFAELELLVKNFSKLVSIIVEYMPVSIEIVDPERITEATNELNGTLNDLTAKLHSYNTRIKELYAITKLREKASNKN